MSEEIEILLFKRKEIDSQLLQLGVQFINGEPMVNMKGECAEHPQLRSKAGIRIEDRQDWDRGLSRPFPGFMDRWTKQDEEDISRR